MMTHKRESQSDGFRASLNGTSLFDLIQFECNRQSQGAALVRSEGRSGRLHFAGGQVVHASTEELTGEAALFRILSWPGGEVLPLRAPGRTPRTIERSWQDLLMEAACAEDEAKRQSAPPAAEGAEVLALHPERHTAVGLRSPAAGGTAAALDPPLAVTLGRAQADGDTTPASLDYARSGPDGTLLDQTGNGAWMQQTGSYVNRLADLIGASLALEGFERLDASIGAHRLVVHVDATGIATARGNAAHGADALLEGVR